LFNANKRLYTAYTLKESFEQLWDYDVAGWARRFFDNWRESLKALRVLEWVNVALGHRFDLGNYAENALSFG
jgi:Transposase